MWRACLCLGVLLAACWRGHSGEPQPLENRAGGERDLTGAFWCSIQDGAYRYEPFPCVIKKADDRWMLAKLRGSQRFEGEIVPSGSGFSFSGRFYCPYGDCTQPLHGEFRAARDGALIGRFRDAAIVVRLVPAPTAAFGGTSYGGDEYGGFGYGGADYGGAKIRRNRPR